MGLSSIDFGDSSALADLPHLRRTEIFYAGPSWSAVQDSSIKMIFGRKGSGKTALRLICEDRIFSGRLVVNLNFLGFGHEPFLNKIRRLRKYEDFSTDHFLASVWRYVFTTSVSSRIIRYNHNSTITIRPLLTKCKSILETPGPELPAAESALTFSLYDTFVNSLDMVPDLLQNPTTSPSDKLHFPCNARFLEAERELVGALRKAQTPTSIGLFIDDFDEDSGKFHESVRMLIFGLLDATRQYYNTNTESPLCIKAFLPNHAVIPSEYLHQDKIGCHQIKWMKNDIKMFIAKRIHVAIRGSGGIPYILKTPEEADLVLKTVLPPLSGNNEYRDAFSWIVHSTHGRPRDVQAVFGELQRIKLGEDPNAKKWEEQDLYKILPEICIEQAEKIQTEYSAKYPELRTVIHAFYEASAEQDRDEVMHTIQNIRGLQQRDPQAWIDALYECGFLCKIVKNVVLGGTYTYSVKCSWHEDSKSTHGIMDERFVIHRVFWDRLQLQRPSWTFRYSEYL